MTHAVTHRLAALDAPAGAVAALAALNVVDLEHLIGMTEVPGVAPWLAGRLGLSLPELSALLEQLAAQAPEAAARTARSPRGPGGLGALEPTDEILAEIERERRAYPGSEARPPLPAEVDLTAELSPVRDQGGRGTCVAFALTALHEHLRRTQGAHDFSEQFLYAETKRVDFVPWICGTWLIAAAGVIARLGQCTETVWPYQPWSACNDHGEAPPDARTQAASFKPRRVILGFRASRPARETLAAGAPVALTLPIYNSWAANPEVWRTGRLNLPLDGEPSQGGHAVCLAGYRDDPSEPGGGSFIIRNSWGPAWGRESPYGPGYGTLPYAYVDKHGWELVALR